MATAAHGGLIAAADVAFNRVAVRPRCLQDDLMELPDLPKTEVAIIEMTNAFRAEQKLGAVKPNAALSRAAKSYAQFLAKSGLFSHTADNRQHADRTKEAGYKHCIVAENLAMNQDSRGFATGALAQQAVTGWKNSPPHRAAMLHPHFTDIGVGIVKAADAAPKYLSVQLFGRPESLTYSFQVKNLAGQTVSYELAKDAIDLPKNTVMKHTICTPETLSVKGVTGTFQPTDGAVFSVSKLTSGGLKVETAK
jgi:uncharacterized protein YkwD